jgi:hypothetical protein
MASTTTTVDSGGSLGRSRWIDVVEVLNGSISTYRCVYDPRDYPQADDFKNSLEHVAFRSGTGAPIQAQDGLLDVFADEIKFGVADIDGLSAAGDNKAGAFSYGPARGDINLGIRSSNATAGGLVTPEANDDQGQMLAANGMVQQAISNTRPYGNVGFGSALSDLATLFETDPDLMPFDEGTGDGDPYYNCRQKAVVIITSGLSDLPDELLGYPSPAEAAAALLAEGVMVFVVSYQAPIEDFDGLDEIAVAGGTIGAYFAEDQDELQYSLEIIANRLTPPGTSGIDTAYTNRTLKQGDLQYRFFGSYSPSDSSPLDNEGHLDQYIYRCDSTCNPTGWTGGASLCESFSLGQALNERSDPRLIYTQVAGVLEPLEIDNDTITADLLGIPDTGTLPQLDLALGSGNNPILDGGELGDATDPAIRALYREQLIRLLRADANSRRQDTRLGSIYNSQPALTTDLYSLNLPLPSFMGYRALPALLERPTALFVASADGLLHAFRVDRDPDSITEADYGTELWAFMPQAVAGLADYLSQGEVTLLDGSPVVKDLRVVKDSASMDLADEIEAWRSILVMGYGEGGRGLFALDVTDPTTPIFKWEISETQRCFNDNEGLEGCTPSTDFALLGDTVSTPAVVSAYFSFSSKLQERGVVIVGGGDAVTGDASAGLAVFVIDLDSGTLVQAFCNDCGNVVDDSPAQNNTEGLDCPMVGDVAAFDASAGGLATRAFLGDSCGQLWRLDLRSTNPSDWRLVFFADAFPDEHLNPAGLAKRRPLTNAPALAHGYMNGRLVVIAATGDPTLDAPGVGVGPDQIMSLTESWDSSNDSFTALVNWRYAFASNEIFTSGPLVFSSAAYFTTLLPGEGSCGVGEGRLWGAHFTGHELEETDDVEAALDLDGSFLTTDDIELYRSFENSEVYGLSLLQTPSCTDSLNNYLPWATGVGATPPSNPTGLPPEATTGSPTFGGTSGGTLELVVQTGQIGEQSDKIQPQDGENSTGNKTLQALPTPGRSMMSTSWGVVFD